MLQEDQLPFPKLSLSATAGPRSTQGEGDECMTGQQVLCTVRLTREHAKKAGEGAVPTPNNPQVCRAGRHSARSALFPSPSVS